MSLTPQQIAQRFAQVRGIVSATTTVPTIVNESSNFVVATYWWGRGRENFNTARPCGEFYENLLNKPIHHLSMEDATPKRFRDALLESPEFTKFIKKKTNDYLGLVVTHAKEGRTFSGLYTQKSAEQINQLLFDTILAYVETILPDIRYFQQLFIDRAELETTFQRRLKAGLTSKAQLDTIRDRLLELQQEKNDVLRRMKATVGPFKNAMDRALRYADPLTYDQMISNWEAACAKAGCNYLAVEYPQFTEPGGYQLAINAKPHFIQKALDLCRGVGNRGVLYIDGDMTVNRYPAIFDVPDVDMMARGWNIDPRASSRYEESILVDPYTFETSGGTMFFGQTPEAHLLLQRWIEVSEQPSQWGKADDRILSLVFNTYKLLLPLKIIQLPVEYLWLSMAYDDYMEGEDIVLEHPECLTTEETASGQGASSDRTPKYYDVIEDLYPRSEYFHEAVMFPTAESTDSFRPYLNYISKAKYLSDVENEDLIGEPALIVVPFKDGLAPYQTIVDANIVATQNISLSNNRNHKFIITNNDATTVPTIISALLQGMNVHYIPDSASAWYKNSLESTLQAFPRLEFAFVNVSNDDRRAFYFQTKFNPAEPAFFAAGCPQLLQLLMTCQTLDDISSRFQYEYISRIRTTFLKRARMTKVGGSINTGNNDKNAEDGLLFLYGSSMRGGYTRRRRLRLAKRNRKSRRVRR